MTWVTQQQQFFCKEVHCGRYWSKYFWIPIMHYNSPLQKLKD
jgi:hypothetical protein